MAKRKIENKKLVVVAMSGGVDSSVAAVLLKRQGYDVIGLTMCFNFKELDSGNHCCGLEGIRDARTVAAHLGIRHYVLNFQEHLQKYVIDDFCQEYAKGRTPNPCVRCNYFLKFGILLKKAQQLGADYIATGHYARIRILSSKSYLLKGKDPHKDQSYFLYRLSSEQLANTLFPLGALTKLEVRQIARDEKLPIAEKPGSQEICFLPHDDYRAFIQKHYPHMCKPGDILDSTGKRLGTHRGIALYTIGQRQGLGVAYHHPLYITRLDVQKNTMVVGTRMEASKSSFLITKPHWINEEIKKKVALKVKIRYNHIAAPAYIYPDVKSGCRVQFNSPQFAITPGQSAVFYRKDTVVGGGIIERVYDET